MARCEPLYAIVFKELSDYASLPTVTHKQQQQRLICPCPRYRLALVFIWSTALRAVACRPGSRIFPGIFRRFSPFVQAVVIAHTFPTVKAVVIHMYLPLLHSSQNMWITTLVCGKSMHNYEGQATLAARSALLRLLSTSFHKRTFIRFNRYKSHASRVSTIPVKPIHSKIA